MDDWAKIRQLFSTGQHSERVGWAGSASVFREKVAAIRPEYVPPDPADRLVHEPGRQVQCDLWFPRKPLPLGNGQEGTPPVLVMPSTFSGFFQALMLPSRKTPDLLGGMWSLLQAARAVPKRLLWDNETGIGRGKLTERTAAFAGTLGTEVKLLKARDPESKGMVERRNRFFRSSFMPGRAFASPQDFNEQMASWLPMGITQYRLAQTISVPARRINEIVHGKRAISPDTALRLSRALGTSDRFWMNLQSRYDLDVATEKHHDALDRIVPLVST